MLPSLATSKNYDPRPVTTFPEVCLACGAFVAPSLCPLLLVSRRRSSLASCEHSVPPYVASYSDLRRYARFDGLRIGLMGNPCDKPLVGLPIAFRNAVFSVDVERTLLSRPPPIYPRARYVSGFFFLFFLRWTISHVLGKILVKSSHVAL